MTNTPKTRSSNLVGVVIPTRPSTSGVRAESDETHRASWLLWWDPRRGDGVDHELVWGAVLLAVFGAARLLPSTLFMGYQCPFHQVTGIPCPTCGMTRATLHAVHLDWGAALAVNPLGTLALALAGGYVLYAAIVTVWRLPRPRINVHHRFFVLFFRLLLPLALVANWVYLITHGV